MTLAVIVVVAYPSVGNHHSGCAERAQSPPSIHCGIPRNDVFASMLSALLSVGAEPSAVTSPLNVASRPSRTDRRRPLHETLPSGNEPYGFPPEGSRATPATRPCAGVVT